MTTDEFTRKEYEGRLRGVHEEMERRRLDLLILTSPEAIYYVSGYMTRAIAAHQYLAVPAGQPPLLATRARDLGNFYVLGDRTPISDHVGYLDDAGAPKPIDVFIDLLRKHGVRTRRIGVEKAGIFLPIEHYEKIVAAFDKAAFIDATAIVEDLRLIKSAAELECHRRAGKIVVEGVRAGVKAAHPGNCDSDVAAATAAALITAGSEWIATWPVVRFGAQTGRSHSSWQHTPILAGQPTTIETAAVVARYHSPLYTTIIHRPTAEMRDLAGTVREAWQAGLAAVRPGATAGEVYRAIEGTIARRGHSDHFMGRVGYSVGIAFSPNWVQRLGIDIVRDSDRVLAPGMVFHLIGLLQSFNKFGLGVSSTVAVTENGSENLTADMDPGPFLFD